MAILKSSHDALIKHTLKSFEPFLGCDYHVGDSYFIEDTEGNELWGFESSQSSQSDPIKLPKNTIDGLYDDRYIDYAVIYKYLYTTRCTYPDFYGVVRDWIEISGLTGFDEFDDNVYYYYSSLYYHDYRSRVILRSKYDYRSEITSFNVMPDSYSQHEEVIDGENHIIPKYSDFICRGILLNDVIEMSKKYGKKFVMDLICDANGVDKFEVDKDKISQEVELILKNSI